MAKYNDPNQKPEQCSPLIENSFLRSKHPAIDKLLVDKQQDTHSDSDGPASDYVRTPYVKTPYVKTPYVKTPYVRSSLDPDQIDMPENSSITVSM